MTTTGRTTECSANRRRAFGSLSSTDVSTTYTRVRTLSSVELQGAVATSISVTVILSAGRTLASARLDHGPKAVGLLNSPPGARERISDASVGAASPPPVLARYVAESSDSRTPRRCHPLVICSLPNGPAGIVSAPRDD